MMQGFWDWSLSTYSRPGVADQLIALQDRYGANVNLILWCLWLGGRAVPVESSLIDKAIEGIEDSQCAISEIRTLRRLTGRFLGKEKPLYILLKNKELGAERMEQATLQVLADKYINWPECDRPPPISASGSKDGLSWLAAYCHVVQAAGHMAIPHDALVALSDAAYPLCDDTLQPEFRGIQ
ncbi:MAG: TIGR02444 family protein [Pseudomonadota bacterium]